MTPRTRRALLGTGAVFGMVLAIVLGVSAFTRFDTNVPDESETDAVQRWNDQAFDDSFQSVLLGVGSAFSLLAAFACGQAFRQAHKVRP